MKARLKKQTLGLWAGNAYHGYVELRDWEAGGAGDRTLCWAAYRGESREEQRGVRALDPALSDADVLRALLVEHDRLQCWVNWPAEGKAP